MGRLLIPVGGPKLRLLLVVTGENSSSASNAAAALLALLLFILLFCSLSFASSRSNSSSSSSRCRLVELALDTNQVWPFDSLVDEEIAAPARRTQSESFLSSAESELRFNSSLVTPFLSLVPPGVVGPDRGCCWFTNRCVLDFDFGRERFVGFRRDTREDDRDRIEGVVGAERPSM
jgi:hypothetical protein